MLKQISSIIIGILFVISLLLVANRLDYVNIGDNYINQRMITIQDNPYVENIYKQVYQYYELTGNENIEGYQEIQSYQMNYTINESQQLEFGGCANVIVKNCTGKLFCNPTLIIQNFTFTGYGRNYYDENGTIIAYESQPCFEGNAIVHSHPIIKTNEALLQGRESACYFSQQDMLLTESHKIKNQNLEGQKFHILVCDEDDLRITTTDGVNSYYGFRYNLGFFNKNKTAIILVSLIIILIVTFITLNYSKKRKR